MLYKDEISARGTTLFTPLYCYNGLTRRVLQTYVFLLEARGD